MSQIDPLHDSNDPAAMSNGGMSNGGVLATIDNRLPSVPSLNWSYGAPQKPDIINAKPTPVELLHAVRRRWPLAIGLGTLVGTVAAALVWYFVPVRYEAFALIRVSDRPPSVLQKPSDATEAYATFKRTQVEMFGSGMVLRSVVRDPGIMKLSVIKEHNDDPVSWLKGELLLDYPNDAEILRVAMKGKKKDEMIKIVDALVDKYMSEIVGEEKSRRAAHEQHIEKQFGILNEEYNRKWSALELQKKTKGTETTESARIKKRLADERVIDAITARNTIEKQITDTKLEIAELKARNDEPDSSKVPDAMVEHELSKDPVVFELNRRLADAKHGLARYMALAKNPAKSPTVRDLNKEINQIEQAIEEHKAEQRPRVVEMLAAKDVLEGDPRSRAVTVPMLEKRLAHLEEELVRCEEAITEHAKAFDNLRVYAVDLESDEEHLRTQRLVMSELKQKLDRSRVEQFAQERITKVDPATLASPEGDVMRKYVAILFSGALGFSLVVLGIAFAEFQKRKLNTSGEVNDGLGIKVIGELPSLRGRKWRRLKGGKGQAVLKALMAERIDGARTALIHSTVVDSPRVVMVTSADPHEGKTTTSTQLAASLARSGRRTLLIDADIRNPGVHRVFDMPLEPGLSELLRGEAERDAVIHPTRTANLWLMPAGRCDLKSVQALSTAYLGTGIAALSVQFDFVVIDSGPILKVADSLLVGQHVDAAIISVLRDSSKVPNVYEACERLRSVGITVLGAVVNGVNDDAARHGIELLMSEAAEARG
jgi:polysaccharide biosynthesis transport protein